MDKAVASRDNRIIAERQLASARRVLTHFVELYQSGQWRVHYKEDHFVETVRQARQAFDYWTKECDECVRN